MSASLEGQFSEEKAWRKGPGIVEGADVEEALLGSPDIPEKEKVNGYVSFADALELVKKHQPDILERSLFIKDLRKKVSALCLDTATPVKFFTAVGTPLDIYHGVDAFFEQDGRIATIDVSMREKEERQKADVFVPATMDKEGNVSVPKEEIYRAAEKIAMKLNIGLKPVAA